MVVTSKLQICNCLTNEIFIKVFKRFLFDAGCRLPKFFANRGKVTKQDIAKRKSPALCKQTKQSKGGKAGEGQ